MSYEPVEDITRADIAFRVYGNDPGELFLSGAEALLSVMMEDTASISFLRIKTIELENNDLDLLLFDFLQEFIFYKDAENLILVPRYVKISKPAGTYVLKSELRGEAINSAKHKIKTDIKAVTLHNLYAEEKDGIWHGGFVLDV